MEEFNIVNQHKNDKTKLYLKPVQGERVLINNHPCFLFIDPEETAQGVVEGWNVSHLETGMLIATDLIKERAIEKAKLGFILHPKAIEKGKAWLVSNHIEIPVNV